MATDDPSNPWSNSGWNVTQQGQYHQQHGQARAEARARDAGTTLGGRRPSGGGGKAGQQPAAGGTPEQKVIILKKITAGWSPLLAVVADGTRRVHRIIGWTGGQGQPPTIGQYLGPTGLVSTAAAATDIRGAQGAPGAGGGGTSNQLMVTATAAQALGGQRVVRVAGVGSVDYADSTNAAHVGLVLGITTTAVGLGDDTLVQVAGDMVDPSFTFVPGPVYFTATGVLTQSAPATGFVQQVATAISATEIVVQLGLPIVIQ